MVEGSLGKYMQLVSEQIMQRVDICRLFLGRISVGVLPDLHIVVISKMCSRNHLLTPLDTLPNPFKGR